MPFFKVLKKAFEWTDECQKAFQDLKAYLTTTPLLSPFVPGEELYLYLAVSPHAVSSALIREAIYYTSRAQRGADGQYPIIEKLSFALIIASRKLRHYFQAYFINVLIDHQLKKAMNKLEATGQLIQWVVELIEFDIKYQPNYGDLDEADKAKKLVVYIDGSSTQYARGIGVILKSPEGDKLKYAARLQYQTTNNKVEYEALLRGLELGKSLGAESIVVQGDSQLIMGQVDGIGEAKEE